VFAVAAPLAALGLLVVLLLEEVPLRKAAAPQPRERAPESKPTVATRVPQEVH
jgi:hypothetical protein